MWMFSCADFVSVLQSSVTHRISYESWLASRGLMLSPFHVRWQTTMFNRLFAYCARINPRALYMWYGFCIYIIHSAVPVVFLNFNRVQLVSKMVENVYVVTHKPKLTFTNVYKWFDSGASGKPGHLSFLMCFSNKTTFCFCFFFLNKQNSPSLLDYKTYIYKLQIQYAQ